MPGNFSDWFGDACKKAKVPGRAHGLRKAAASRLAEFGCTEREIMAITGHTTSKEVDRYAKSARQKVLAKSAMEKMLLNTQNDEEKRTHLQLVVG
ncbi:tyrosine-type recombinase/integrase [Brucella tritici]|uniref:Tyrosine-type recombinase/integrase n=1 Tax=Brucella tritici TaxID=94626 RepID=A0A7V8B1Z9_9HYPH|nr:tyrosine-type recombinase/integrase [Brucella tritici]KAB2656594.1 tyrosine-type recombinase/integrase [Brucella tritici]